MSGVCQVLSARTVATATRSGLSALILLTVLACSSSDDQPQDEMIDDPASTVIDTSNHLDILTAVFEVAGTEILRPVSIAMDTVYGTEPSGVPDQPAFLVDVSSTYDPDTGVVRYEYACSDGGSYQFIDSGSVVGGGSGQFDACRFDSTEYDGSFTRTNTLIKFVYSPGWSVSTVYSGFSQTALPAGTALVVDGTVDRFDGENENSERWQVTSLSRSDASGETLVENGLIQLYAGEQADNPDNTTPWQRTFSGDFSLSSPQTGGNTVLVTTEKAFVSQERTGSYTSGELLVRAEDGSELRIVADNGDPTSFQADVSNDGSVSSFTYPWEGPLHLRCLADPQDPASVAGSC